MKLIQTNKNFKTDAEALPEHKFDFRAIRNHLIKKAKPGLPYNILTIMHELNINKLMKMDGYYYTVLSLVLKQLMNKYGWRQCSLPGYFCFYDKSDKVGLAPMIDAFVPSNSPFTLSGNARMVRLLTGEDIKAETIRKAVTRLAKEGRFVRLERGKYKRTHIGF